MTAERRNQIIELIQQKGAISNKEIMETFGISIETVRRDLKYLEKNGNLRCVYGGAVAVEQPEKSSDCFSNPPHAQEKMMIAREAAKLVQEGDVIFLDEGATVLKMTEYLKRIPRLTVITNALRVAIEMCDAADCNVFIAGGKLHPGRLAISDRLAQESLGRYNIEKAFVGTSGISGRFFSDDSSEVGCMRHYIIENSQKTIMLADHSKFSRTAALNTGSVKELDIVVTDRKTGAEDVRYLQQAGVQVIVAGLSDEETERI